MEQGGGAEQWGGGLGGVLVGVFNSVPERVGKHPAVPRACTSRAVGIS